MIELSVKRKKGRSLQKYLLKAHYHVGLNTWCERVIMQAIRNTHGVGVYVQVEDMV